MQEEIGTRKGSKVAAYTIAPGRCGGAGLTADLPGVEGEQAVVWGKGAVVGFMDSATIYPRDLYELCHKLGAERGIPVQTKTKVAGGNDAGHFARLPRWSQDHRYLTPLPVYPFSLLRGEKRKRCRGGEEGALLQELLQEIGK